MDRPELRLRSLQTERQGFTYKKLYKEPGARKLSHELT